MINVTVIGFGGVGSTLSLLLLNNQYPMRLNVMDPNPECSGAFLDLAHGAALCDNKEFHINNEELFLQSDFIYYAAGVPNKHGGSRLSTARQNRSISQEIFEHRTFVNTPYIIVITNPVDLISQAVYTYSGLPKERIIGTGTFLENVRLAHYLSTLSDFKPADFDTMVLGEHGESQVPLFSHCKVKGQAIVGHKDFTIEILNKASHLTKNAAFEIRKTQKGTTYGVSKCAEVLLDYLLGSEEHNLSLSVLTNAHYRDLLSLNQDIFIGLPVTIKNGKITIKNDVKLTEEELEGLRKSAKVLSEED